MLPLHHSAIPSTVIHHLSTILCWPGGIRTRILPVKSRKLRQLSYEPIGDDESTWTINLHRIRMLLCHLSYAIKKIRAMRRKKKLLYPLSYGFLFAHGEPEGIRTPDPPIRNRSISFLRHLIAVYTGIEPASTHRQWVMFAITPIDFEIAVKSKQWEVSILGRSIIASRHAM